MADSSMSLLARALDVTPQSVRAVVYSQMRSRRIEEAISKITGEPLCELWPQWHGLNRLPSKRPRSVESRLREIELKARLAAVPLPIRNAA
jgi:hypothetical protein